MLVFCCNGEAMNSPTLPLPNLSPEPSMAVYIPRDIRVQVWNDARGLCGYCLTHEELIGIAHEFEQ